MQWRTLVYDDDDDDDLVPLGDVIAELDAQRETAARTTAAAVLRTQMRQLPAAHDAEHAILCCVLTAGAPVIDVLRGEGVTPAHFAAERHKMIAEAMFALADEGQAIDTLTVVERLQLDGNLAAVGGTVAVASIEASMASVENAGAYARLVREKATLRGVIMAATEAASSAFAQQRSSATIIDDIRNAMVRLEQGGGASSITSNAITLRAVRERMPALGGTRVVLATGLPSVDKHFGGGWEPGDLIIIAARPSMGKTQFVLDIADDLAVRRQKRVLFFSLEMDREQLLTRMMGARAGVDVKRANIARDERDAIEHALAALSSSSLFIDDRVGLGIAGIIARARAMHAEEPLAAIIVDYLQLMHTPGGAGADNANAQIGAITKGLKTLARQLQIPVVCLSQLNRGVESRPNKRPMMSDLRDSGNIEQDADIIGFLYRDEYYERDRCPEDKKGIAEFIIAKYRNGAAGKTIRLRFAGDGTPRFGSLEETWPR